MVDFNNDVTIGTPAVDVERISILQRRYDLLEALEDYKKKKFQGSNTNMSIVRARLISYFLEIQAILKRRLKDPEYIEVISKVFSSDNELEILDLIYKFNEMLDDIRLIRIDNKRLYDPGNVEAENEAQGY